MERFFFHILLVLLAVALPARAVTWTHPEPLRPDSSNFVTASLLVTATLAVRTAAHALRPHRRRAEKSKISHA